MIKLMLLVSLWLPWQTMTVQYGQPYCETVEGYSTQDGWLANGFPYWAERMLADGARIGCYLATGQEEVVAVEPMRALGKTELVCVRFLAVENRCYVAARSSITWMR